MEPVLRRANNNTISISSRKELSLIVLSDSENDIDRGMPETLGHVLMNFGVQFALTCTQKQEFSAAFRNQTDEGVAIGIQASPQIILGWLRWSNLQCDYS
jgi:hypothetical protein